MEPWTYAPKPVLATDVTFEWCDLGGRSLLLRLDYRGGLTIATSDEQDRAGFRVARGRDTLELLDALREWAEERAAVLRLDGAGPRLTADGFPSLRDAELEEP